MSFRLNILLLLFLMSCSLNPYLPNKREVSSVSPKKVNFDLQTLSDTQAQTAQEYWEIYNVEGSGFVGVNDQKVALLDSSYNQVESYTLAEHDSFQEVLGVEGMLILRSHFGLLLAVTGEEIESMTIGFPVSSFEFVDGHLHLYNANNHGRFCDSLELRRPSHKRDSVCDLIEKKILLR